MAQEHLHRFEVAGASRGHERRLPFWIWRFNIAACLQHQFQNGRTADRRSFHHRRGAVVVRHVHFGAGVDELVGQLHIGIVSRPVKRSGAVYILRANVCTLSNELQGGRVVLRLRRIDERAFRRAPCSTGCQGAHKGANNESRNARLHDQTSASTPVLLP